MSSINWDKRIADRKKRREVQLRRNILLLIAGTLSLLILIAFSVSVKSVAADEQAVSTVKCYKNISVEYGQTLSSIASEYSDNYHYDSKADYIDEVVYMNNLESADQISEGQFLIIPYYAVAVK